MTSYFLSSIRPKMIISPNKNFSGKAMPLSLHETKKNTTAYPELWGHIFYQLKNRPFAPNKNYLKEIIHIICMFLLTFFIVWNLKKNFWAYPKFWGCIIFESWDISACLNWATILPKLPFWPKRAFLGKFNVIKWFQWFSST